MSGRYEHCPVPNSDGGPVRVRHNDEQLFEAPVKGHEATPAEL